MTCVILSGAGKNHNGEMIVLTACAKSKLKEKILFGYQAVETARSDTSSSAGRIV